MAMVQNKSDLLFNSNRKETKKADLPKVLLLTLKRQGVLC